MIELTVDLSGLTRLELEGMVGVMPCEKNFAFPPYRGPGWRVSRVVRRGENWWKAEAIYADVADLPLNASCPDYSRRADGATEEEARANVLAACAADRNWPLMASPR